jgi:hypothetical protein
LKRKHTEDAALALMTIRFALTDGEKSVAELSEAEADQALGFACATCAECLALVDHVMTGGRGFKGSHPETSLRDRITDALVFTEIIRAPSGTWRVFELSDKSTKLSINSDGEIRLLPGASRRRVKDLETLKKRAAVIGALLHGDEAEFAKVFRKEGW